MKVRRFCIRATVGFAMSVTTIAACAQSAGDNVISAGWSHAFMQTGSNPVRITSIGGKPVDMQIPGSGVGAINGDTVELVMEHYFTDHITVAFTGGWPARVKLGGRGSLDDFGTLGDARAWAPQLVLRYRFGSSENSIRPFIGVGVNYTWFTGARVTNQSFITENYGPGGSVTSKVSSSWNPVIEAGFNYNISRNWSVGASVTYIPIDARVTNEGHTANGLEIVSETKLRIRPIITLLSASYRF
ncbi:OmpW/AlkL family protein [Paraburkholderia diazotrophica]|uniref:OmpW/AlkL family protein n=1 Tax=Paraburkholderia diazotrophica TaxID=667676 RepID=UPI003179DEF3